MAKYSKKFDGNYEQFCRYIEKEIAMSSMTSSLEEKQEFSFPGGQGVMLAFERYSYTGSNRVSLTMTILGYDHTIEVIAMTSGGSQATLFKLNTFGEEAFLEKAVKVIENFMTK